MLLEQMNIFVSFDKKKSEFTELELKQPDEHFSTQTPKRLKLR